MGSYEGDSAHAYPAAALHLEPHGSYGHLPLLLHHSWHKALWREVSEYIRQITAMCRYLFTVSNLDEACTRNVCPSMCVPQCVSLNVCPSMCVPQCVSLMCVPQCNGGVDFLILHLVYQKYTC